MINSITGGRRGGGGGGGGYYIKSPINQIDVNIDKGFPHK